jgi:hypothetical protein
VSGFGILEEDGVGVAGKGGSGFLEVDGVGDEG